MATPDLNGTHTIPLVSNLHPVEPITNDNIKIEISKELLTELQNNAYNGAEANDAVDHITRFLEIIDLVKIPNVNTEQLCILAFLYSLTGKARRLNMVNDNIGSAFMSTFKLNESILWHARLGHVHFKRMQDISKDGLILAFDMDTEKWNKKYFVTFIGDASMAVVRLPDPKLKTLDKRGNECIFVGYVEHSKAFMFYVIEPNDSVSINLILESKDVIFDENIFSSVLKPNLRIPNGAKDINGSVVLEEVTEEVVQDEVSDQHSYCFNVGDDPKIFDEAMKSQDVAQVIESNRFVLSKHDVFIRFGYLRNKKYFVTFIGDALRFCYVCLLHSKDEALFKDAIFYDNRFSSILRPNLRIPNGAEDIDGSVVLEEVTKEDAIFYDNRFSSVLRRNLRIPNGAKDIDGSVVLEDVTKEFLLQLQQEWQRFVTLVKQSQELKTVSYHKLYDILKQHQNEVNEIRAERLARTANPLALVAQQQPVYQPQNHPTHYTQNSSTRSQQAATRNRGKAIINSRPPIYDKEPTMVAEDDEISKDNEIDKLMALISLSFKKIYKPTNNNL
nr:zinc finger, CCHC-type [Tanacetum cinerariifolium]